ncbi:hypothetical protein LCGC14_0368530 [marine sediment metagenome]|uniref:Fibronectin type-III domain-containing protein n=1 Tax=marine sediment metagenome TaxID=412755 RepID=A0A0F9VT52_9ZZZZ
MATQTRGANTGVNELGFTDPSNVTSEDVVCASAAGSDLDEMYCTFLAGSITSSSFDAFHFQVVAGIFYAGGGFVARVSKDGGSTYCSGHDIRSLIPSAACAGVGSTGWVLCSHSQAPSSEADWEQTDNRIRLSRGTGNSTLFVDYVEIRATYTPIVVPDAPTWAAQPFPLANRDLTELEVDWVAPAGGDAPTGYDLQWDTDSSFPTPPTQMIDVGLVTIYNHTGRSSGTRYYYRIRGYNTVGDGAWTATESTYTEPVQPTGLAVANTVAQRLDLSWNAVTVSPAGTVLYDIQWDTDGSPGGETNLSLNQSAITVNHTVGADNTLRYYWVRAQSPDVDGNGTTEGQYNTKVSGTTWSVPNTENLSTATTPDDSMILITRDGSYPSGGSGNPPEGVDTWEVWRSTSSDGAYSELVTGLTATTYEDWSVNGGETWYYKAKFTNLIGDSALSTNPVSNTATTPEVQQSFGENVPADSAYSYDTTNEANDDIGTRDFNDTGVSITYSNSGGVFSQGYADLPGSGGYLQANPSQITTENWWITTWVNPDVFVNSTLLMGVQTSTASHYVLLYMNGTSGGVRVDINKTGTGFRTNTWTSTLSTSSWQLITLAYDHSTTTVYFSDGNTLESYQHDLGALNFGNGFIRMGGGGPAIYNGQYSNTLLWENELPTVARLDQLLADGDLVSAAAPQDGFDSDTRIKVIDNLIEPLSDTAIYRDDGIGTSPPLVDSANLEGYYPLDYEVLDYSGNTAHGTNNGITFTTGKVNQAGLFERSNNDYVSTPIDISDYSAFSISAWFNTTEATDRQMIIGQDVTGDRIIALQLHLSLAAGERLLFYDGSTQIKSSIDPVINTWYHVVVIHDSSNYKLYLNGAEVASGAGSSQSPSAITLDIGRRTYAGANDHFDGRIDEVRIYKVVLTPQQIQEIGASSTISDTAIYQEGWDTKDKLSDTAIYQEGWDTIEPLSDTRIKVIDNLIEPTIDPLNNGDFETGTHGNIPPTDWDAGNGKQDSNALFVQAGSLGVRLVLGSNPYSAAYIEQNVNFPVTNFVSMTLWLKSANLTQQTVFTYTDDSTTTIDHGSVGTQWEQKTILITDLDSGQIVKTIKIESIGSGAPNIAAVDEIVLTLNNEEIGSNTRIFVPDNLIESLSDTAIYQPGWDTIEPTSDTRIRNTFEITKLSDSTVLKIGEVSRVSNTTISKAGIEITKISETAIFREGFVTLDITSDSRVKLTSQKITYLSDSRIKNTYEQSPLSDSTIFRSQYGDIQVSSDARIVFEGTVVLPSILSDSRIKTASEFTKTSDTFIVLGFEINKLSDTAIFQADYGDITKTSDTAIFADQYGDITKLSDATIFKSGLLIDKLSDTRIFRPGGYMYPLQDQEKTSDTRILALGQEITKKSLTRIKDDSNDITKLSDTLIMLHPVINKTSDTKIKFIDNALLILSSTRIKNTLELNPTSDAAIFRSQYGDITKLSDTLILREPIINKTSDTTIVKLFEFSGILSDTYIINIGTQIDINSNTAIFRAGYGQILKESRTAIKQFGLEKTKLSNTRITKTITLNKVSDTAIRRDRSPIVVIFEKGRQL